MFARFDQRLYDLIVDWLRVNGEIINIPRLKAILKEFPMADVSSLALMAALVKTKKWDSFAKGICSPKTDVRQPLFLSLDGNENSFFPQLDKTALSYGFKRNPYVPSDKVVPFGKVTPGTLLLRLRGAFGLSARAEAVLAMLNKEACRIQDVADCGRFSWKTANDVLNELALSGIALTHDNKQRGRLYYLKEAPAMRALFGVKSVVFPDWVCIFTIIGRVCRVFENQNLDKVSKTTVINEVEMVLTKADHSHLLLCGIPSFAKVVARNIVEFPRLIRSLK